MIPFGGIPSATEIPKNSFFGSEIYLGQNENELYWVNYEDTRFDIGQAIKDNQFSHIEYFERQQDKIQG